MGREIPLAPGAGFWMRTRPVALRSGAPAAATCRSRRVDQLRRRARSRCEPRTTGGVRDEPAAVPPIGSAPRQRTQSSPRRVSADPGAGRGTLRTLAGCLLLCLAWLGSGCSVADSRSDTLDAEIEILTYVQDTVPIVKQAILSENELVTKLDSGMMGPGQKVAYIEEEILPVERDLLEELNQVEPADPQLKSAHEEALLMAEKGVAAFEAYASYYAGNIDAKPRAAELRSDQVRHRSAWIRTVLALEERVDLQ